ncbi:hypothetical protein DFH29DRAFT_879011 [Suillus ampliporus]|nr:hypothetical protein DFH29DRAFT_879011 [Suillus ampliporus]
MKVLDNVKSKVLCSEHQGENTFCWVDKTQLHMPHYPLSVQDLQEWATYLHQARDPDNACITLPDTPHFHDIRKTRQERSTSSLQRVPTELLSPVIHNHIHISPATHDSDGALVRPQGDGAQPLKRSYALYMESDEESDDDEPLRLIEDVLTSVHSRCPALNMFQYIRKLKNHGIEYLMTAARFNMQFYEDKVGMPAGAAYTFHNCVSKAHMKAERVKERKKAKGKKKARAPCGDKDEENIPPSF